jgi:hypothetical protein
VLLECVSVGRQRMLLRRISVGVALFSLLGSAPELAVAMSPQQQGNDSVQSGNSQPSGTTSDTQSGAAAPSVSPQDSRSKLPDAPSAAQDQDSQSSSSKSPSSADQQVEQNPTGTAAARSANVKGGAASRPAGAAIAPAKAHQRRSLLIKLGLLAGAGVAIGSVAALSKGSPSTPPGTR